MKKIVLLISFLAMYGSASFAQVRLQGDNFRFGLQLSPTWAWLKTDDKNIESFGSNWGVKFGTLVDYYFAPNYAVTTGIGLGFNQGGTIQNGHQLGVFWPKSDLSSSLLDTVPKNTKLHYRVNYVEIPIGLRFRGGSGEDSRIKFFAEAPVFTLGFVTKAIGDIRGSTVRDQNVEDENIREDVNGLSLSWGLGAGIEYEVAEHSTLVAGLSFQQQFTDVTSDKDARIFRNNTWQKEDSKGTIGMIALRLGFFF
jgi:Outer membrane protein beta-barrel domain